MISLSIISFLILSGCSLNKVDLNGKNAEASSEINGNSKDEYKNDASILKEVSLNKIKLKINTNWQVEEGLDSIAFTDQSMTSIGGIDGLGYSDSIESLLPNHSKLIKKNERIINNIKTVFVETQSESLSSKQSDELHIFYFFSDMNVVYDLHFKRNKINKNEVMEIANSVIKK